MQRSKTQAAYIRRRLEQSESMSDGKRLDEDDAELQNQLLQLQLERDEQLAQAETAAVQVISRRKGVDKVCLVQVCVISND